METPEYQIEQYLVHQVRKMGGWAYKFTSPGNAGVPDRICVFPTGYIVFVEVKNRVGRIGKLQNAQIRKLKFYEAHVVVVNSRGRVKSLLKAVADKIEKRKHVKILKEVL